MDWKTLFFGFDGRIGRKTWWLASIFLIATGLALNMLVNPKSWLAAAPPNVADTLLGLAMIIPETAVSVKRFNDRGWPQVLPYCLALLSVSFTVLLHFRLILTGDESTLTDELVFGGSLLVIALVVIDNGLLRGTRGPNRFGPDPIEHASANAVAKAKKNPHAA